MHVASERDHLLHLLRRTTCGVTPALVTEAARLGRAAWLEAQLAPAALRDPEGDAVLARFPALSLPTPEVRRRADAGTLKPWDLMFSLGQATIGRAIWSRRQLLEVMVDFWSNHLNVTCPCDDVWDSRHHYDADVHPAARARPLRRHAAAPRPAPGDAALPRQRLVDEGRAERELGRELLELHTVGVGAGYTERGRPSTARASSPA